MFLIAQLTVAGVLVLLSAAVVFAWLLGLALSLTGGLLPWVAAGVVQYGLISIGLAAIPGIPGILWAKILAQYLPTASRRIAIFLARVGSLLLVLGLFTALLVLVVS